MIVNAGERRTEHIIAGSGPLAYTFGILDENDLEVIQSGVTLTLNQYQVTGVGQDGGGTVVLATSPADGTRVVIIGKQPLAQTSVYNLEAFPPQRIQRDFNKVVIGLQQLSEIIGRSFRLQKQSFLNGPEIPDPTVIDQFLRIVSLSPLTLGWGTLATLAGAVTIPLAQVNGGTGASYSGNADLLQGIGAARWGTLDLTPAGNILTLPNPLNGNRIAVGAGAISSLTTTGVAIGTIILLDYIIGSNLLTDSSTFQLQGRSNYTTIVGDSSWFYFNGTAWIELHRSNALSAANALKFRRGDGTLQSVATSAGSGVARGLIVSNNATDPGNDIDIAAGDAFSDDADPAVRIQMYSPSIMVKQLDATWAAGSNAGGRVPGQTLADGTWHIFMFRRIGGAIDFCLSNSLIFATPDGGTNRVCIMSILREAGAIAAFTQKGDYVNLNVKSIQRDTLNPGLSTLLTTMRSPSAIACRVKYVAQIRTTTTGTTVRFYSTYDVDTAPGIDVAPLSNNGSINTNVVNTYREMETYTDLLQQIRTRFTISGTDIRVRIQTEGYYHPRGRE